MKKIELPAWHEAERLVIGGYAHDAIDKFVYDNEPAGGAEDYREDLQAALQVAYERGFKDGKEMEKSIMKNIREIQGLI